MVARAVGVPLGDAGESGLPDDGWDVPDALWGRLGAVTPKRVV